MTEDLARRFAFHAGIYAGDGGENSSPLYAALSSAVAADPAILALVERADRATQVSNLLFTAVHDLLLAGADHSLRHFYASLVPAPRPPTDAYPVFRAFCLEHADTISELAARLCPGAPRQRGVDRRDPPAAARAVRAELCHGRRRLSGADGADRRASLGDVSAQLECLRVM